MKWIISQLLIFLFCLLAADANAYYRIGDINSSIGYSGIEILYQTERKKKPRHVIGYIYNRTDTVLRFKAVLYFRDHFNRRTAAADIRLSIQPQEKVYFKSRIRKKSGVTFSPSNIEWVLPMPAPEKRVIQKSEKDDGASYSISRRLDYGVRVTGSGKAVSEPFILDRGKYTVGSEHVGDGKFSAKLLNKRDKRIAFFRLKSGRRHGYKNVIVKKSGSFYLDVDAKGPWCVKIEEYLSTKDAVEDQGALHLEKSSRAYEIHLKNGRIICVGSYRLEGGRICFSRFGADLSVERQTVSKIVEKLPSIE